MVDADLKWLAAFCNKGNLLSSFHSDCYSDRMTVIIIITVINNYSLLTFTRDSSIKKYLYHFLLILVLIHLPSELSHFTNYLAKLASAQAITILVLKIYIFI